MAIGRPTLYSPEMAAAICSRLADGESLKAICQADDMPARSSVYLWLTQEKIFSDMYARAREEQADSLADEIIVIADSGGLAPDDRRVRIDARKWVAGKMRPKRYGDKVDLTHAGPDGGPVLFGRVEHVIIDPEG